MFLTALNLVFKAKQKGFLPAIGTVGTTPHQVLLGTKMIFLCETSLCDEVYVYLASLFFFMLKWIQLCWGRRDGTSCWPHFLLYFKR